MDNFKNDTQNFKYSCIGTTQPFEVKHGCLDWLLPGAAANCYVSDAPDFLLRPNCILNNVHLLVNLQLQVKNYTKTNTKPAGAFAKQRLATLPTERVGWK